MHGVLQLGAVFVTEATTAETAATATGKTFSFADISTVVPAHTNSPEPVTW